MKKILPLISSVFLASHSNASLPLQEDEIVIPVRLKISAQINGQDERTVVVHVEDVDTSRRQDIRRDDLEPRIRLKTIANWGFMNKAMKGCVRVLYSIQGFGKFLGWVGATVSTLSATARDYFPEQSFLVPSQKFSLLAGIAGGLVYAGCQYAVQSLEKKLQEFDKIRKAEETSPYDSETSEQVDSTSDVSGVSSKSSA
ncbi:MAG: hypothetical protein LBI30_01375 [Holosporales bacterium]|jgi:hypothetical protein|nr:hypothetical protein [Holosporales bacterium]